MEDKIKLAKQEAFEKETQRIERDIEPKARELAEQWLKEEENFSKQELKTIEVERNRAENALALRVKEVQGQLSELRRKKEEARDRAAQEKKVQQKETVPETKADDIWGSSEPATPVVEQPHVQAPPPPPPKVEEVKKEEPVVKEQPVAAEAPEVEEKIAEKKAPPPISETRPTEKKGIPKVVWYAAAAVVFIVVGFFVYNKLIPNLFPKTINIAILPLKSSEAETNIIASSIAEEIANRLEYAKPVVVMGYSSSSQFARVSADPVRAIVDLGYTDILQGNFKRTGDNYTVDVKLVDSTGNPIWSNSYEATSEKLAELPGTIALQLTEVLSVKVESDASTLLSTQYTSNGTAYVKYLEGMTALRHRTPESIQNALQLFQQAASQDQKFAATLAAAAEALILKIYFGWDMSEATMQRAEQFAQAALNANSSLPQPHIANGKILTLQKKYQSALKEYDAALSITTNNSEAYLAKANVSMETGKYDEAIEFLNHASEFSPRDPEILKLLALAYQLKNDPREAMGYHEALLPLLDDSTHYLIGPMADMALFPEFISSHSNRITAAFDRHLAQNPGDFAAMYRLARLYQISGKTMEASKLLESLTKLLRGEVNAHPQNAVAMSYLGLALTRLGKWSDAATFAKKAIDTDKSNPEVLYKAAQIYSILKKQPESLQVLHDALMLRFNMNEITNGDFYNFHDTPEFITTIQMSLQ